MAHIKTRGLSRPVFDARKGGPVPPASRRGVDQVPAVMTGADGNPMPAYLDAPPDGPREIVVPSGVIAAVPGLAEFLDDLRERFQDPRVTESRRADSPPPPPHPMVPGFADGGAAVQRQGALNDFRAGRIDGRELSRRDAELPTPEGFRPIAPGIAPGVAGLATERDPEPPVKMRRPMGAPSFADGTAADLAKLRSDAESAREWADWSAGHHLTAMQVRERDQERADLAGRAQALGVSVDAAKPTVSPSAPASAAAAAQDDAPRKRYAQTFGLGLGESPDNPPPGQSRYFFGSGGDAQPSGSPYSGIVPGLSGLSSGVGGDPMALSRPPGFADGTPRFYTPSQLRNLPPPLPPDPDFEAQVRKDAANRAAAKARMAASAEPPVATPSPAPSSAPKGMLGRAAGSVGRIAGAAARVLASPAAAGVGMMLTPNDSIATQGQEDAELARYAKGRADNIVAPPPGAATTDSRRGISRRNMSADITVGKGPLAPILEGESPPTPSPSATAAWENSAWHFGKPIPGAAEAMRGGRPLGIAGLTPSDIAYGNQLKEAGGKVLVGDDGTFRGYEMLANAPVSASGLAAQVRATGGSGLTPEEAFSPERVAAARKDAQAFKGPDFYNGIDVRNMGPAEYMAIKAQTGQEQSDLEAAKRYIGLRQNERGAPNEAAARAMAPGLAPSLAMGAAAEQRARNTAAATSAAQTELEKARITAGGKAAIDANKAAQEDQRQLDASFARLAKSGADGAAMDQDSAAWARQTVAQFDAFRAANGLPMLAPGERAAMAVRAALARKTMAQAELEARAAGISDGPELDAAARKIVADSENAALNHFAGMLRK